MNLPSYDWCERNFLDSGLNYSREIHEKLCAYAEFLIEYNEKVNLTAIKEPEEIFIKHFLDSILIVNYVDIPQNSSLVDVGTGAGFPSVPLKIYRNDLKLTLVDSLNKRVTFLKSLCEKLSIDCECVHSRAEELSRKEDYREKYDFAIARAVASLPVLYEYCLPYVKIGGKFIALKGPNEEVSAGENALKVLKSRCLEVKNYNLINGDERRLILLEKISQVPTKYPRNSGQISKKSL